MEENGFLNRCKELMRRELDKFVEVQTLTQSIQEALKQEKPSAAEDILKKRGELLQEVIDIERQIAECLLSEKKDLSFLVDHFSPELVEIRSNLKTVQLKDKEIIGQLANQKEQITEALKKLKLGHLLPDRYQQHERGGPSFVNIKE